MATTTIDAPNAALLSPWAGRACMAASYVFSVLLFATDLQVDMALALAGLLSVHIQVVLMLRVWSTLDRTVRGEALLVVATLVYPVVGTLFWSKFSAWPWSTFFGLVILQGCAMAAVYYWQALRKAPLASWFGLIVILFYITVAAAAPVIAPYGESEIVGYEYEPWGGEFLLGTDNLGRDMLTRLVFGGRNTIGIAFLATCLAFFLGTFTGFLASIIGGIVDQALGRICDIMMAIPGLILILMVLTVTGTSIPTLIIIIGVLDSTRPFRLSRAVSMNIVVMDYVEAARLRGEGLWWIMWREVLPNSMAPLVAEFGLRFCFVFLTLSALSFLGLGIQPPLADWGSMVRENATLITFGDITPLLPAASIALLTVGINFVVDWFLHITSGIRDEQ
jgi:peptide/nickel transport system permease protein